MPHILSQPHGSYGISYDIYTRATEDDLPYGWHSNRSHTYRAAILHLEANGFRKHQYSDFRRDGTSLLNTFLTMITLRVMAPPSKLATTLKGVKMHFISDMTICDQTRELRLGGRYARALEGPAPAALVQSLTGQFANHVPPVMPLNPQPVPTPVALAAGGGVFERPKHTKTSQNANLANSYVQ
ncbi:hypothetical protein OE88DRAFT_1666604 [Heliocybe sulcata]|uniref:Uncharacterized protein n=1 Tax=Heliocybe sulcata TaxID=5364 RepID=A0A5C3MPA0_9AGAM|nr:hypothetical protein OE88DRAFT_1666604 [Heliocybe sulcata]